MFGEWFLYYKGSPTGERGQHSNKLLMFALYIAAAHTSDAGDGIFSE